MNKKIKYLSLFSGAAGGDLGCQHLLGWECVGYVEWEKYCCRVLEQRIRDGVLSDAPIFCGDIRRWIELGYAAAYTGLVDCITGGFPCQPFSVAGERLGVDDPRNMWPATAECVRIIRPRYCFFENVVGLLSSGYFGTIIADLAACGYGVRWGVLSACSVGAPHPRERLFILADANGSPGVGWGERRSSSSSAGGGEACEWGEHLSKDPRPFRTTLWDADEADVLRVANGMGTKLERVRAIGNGQVPIVVATAWNLLTEVSFA
jgi:DNA (cytosine-5)-methyltransferase 1